MNRKLVNMTRNEIQEELDQGKKEFMSAHMLELLLLAGRERYDEILWVVPKGEKSAMLLGVTHADISTIH